MVLRLRQRWISLKLLRSDIFVEGVPATLRPVIHFAVVPRDRKDHTTVDRARTKSLQNFAGAPLDFSAPLINTRLQPGGVRNTERPAASAAFPSL